MLPGGHYIVLMSELSTTVERNAPILGFYSDELPPCIDLLMPKIQELTVPLITHEPVNFDRHREVDICFLGERGWLSTDISGFSTLPRVLQT